MSVVQHDLGDAYELVIFMVHLLFVLALLFLSCLVEPADEAREPQQKKEWFVCLSINLGSSSVQSC
jgi:hypothetical protein